MTNVFKYILFLFLAVAFFLPEYYLPVLEQQMGWQAAALGGDVAPKNKPIFFPKKWMNGRYQKQYEGYLKDQSSTRDLLVRTRNQVAYDLLNTIGNHTIIPGSDGMLFSKDYADAAVGRDFKGEEWIIRQTQKLRTIINYFKEKGVAFLILLPPGKPHVYPEQLPQNYRSTTKKPTNRATFINQFKVNNIPFLDFDFFLDYETQTGMPVYPKAGLHWNYLGAALAADSITSYLKRQYVLTLPAFKWPATIPFSTDFEGTDTELLRSANLLQPQELPPMPYPVIQFETLSDSLAPKAVVIGDSYYQILLKKGYHEALFQEGSPYWHYFGAEGFKSTDKLKKFAKNTRPIMRELENMDLIVLASSETNLTRFGFGFIDYVYEQIKTENK